MVFSSPIFLFAFLPICLAIYYTIHPKLRNLFLFCASSMFYMWGSGEIVLVLLVSVFLNYYLSLMIENPRFLKAGYTLAIGIVANLGMLYYYKYATFTMTELNRICHWFGVGALHVPAVVLPIGISFFTFQGISYLIDVYRREVGVAPSVIDYGMYHTLFPQLIAGPIVRYAEVSKQVAGRQISTHDLFDGVCRFCVGLGKKILLADSLGVIADQVFGLPGGELTTPLSWLGILCYTQQIYFDFSGYSDMAIGLGKMLGFTFPENFDQPYRSQNITEFWRRWHMTLSRCLRDYLYIPLGGNRKGSFRTYFNLCTVFVLCGLWHGAAWSFLAWGAFHGALLIIERVLKQRFQLVPTGIWGVLVTNLLVMISWVIFRADTLPQAMHYLWVMFSFTADSSPYFSVSYYLTHDKVFFLGLAGLLSFFPFERFSRFNHMPLLVSSRGAFALSVFAFSVVVIAVQGFNPFIYFRF